LFSSKQRHPTTFRWNISESTEEKVVEKILIDRFIVPEESIAAFLSEIRKSASILRRMPGYVEGFIYEKKDGASRHNMVTTAVWQNEEAFETAKKTAMAEFHKIGFNPQEIIARLKIEMERGVYERSPY
jgi:heme-degrading monooxygenase HmoA